MKLCWWGYRRCQPERGWQLLLPGVVLLNAGKPTHEQRLRAAALYAGSEARVTGLAAASCHGLRRVPQTDAWWADVGLAWEIDSLDYHLAPEDYRRTVRRNAGYAAYGIPFLQTVPVRLTTEPGKVLDELRSAHAAAAARPAPPWRSRAASGL